MDENEWLNATDPAPMLRFLERRANERKVRLFAVACCRRIWHLVVDERSRQAIKGVEMFADARTNDDRHAIKSIRRQATEAEHACGRNLASRAVRAAVGRSGVYAAAAASHLAALAQGNLEQEGVTAERNRQASLLRDIVANPFATPRPIDPAVLRWNDGTVLRIATGIYEERAFERLPVLADAMLDSGCDDEDLIAHCRSAGPHVRGCYAVDLILGKE